MSVRDLFSLLMPAPPMTVTPENPASKILGMAMGALPMVAGAAILGALSVAGMRQAQRPDHFVISGLGLGVVEAAMGAAMNVLVRRPALSKPRIGPKDWSPRTGVCLCRRPHA